jgi:hypothetical protein
MKNKILTWQRTLKRLVVVLLDLCPFATWLAFTLRLDVLHWPQGSQW